MAQDRNLPEGTDRVVPGASGTVEEVVVVEAVATGGPTGSSAGASGQSGKASTGSGSGTGSSSASQGGRSAIGGGSDSGSGFKANVNRDKIMEKVRTGKEKISGQAGEKARGFVSQGLDRSGEALTRVSQLVNDTAEGIDEKLGAEYGDYARKAAQAIDETARKIRSKDPDELIDDTREFVRKSPAMALAGAAIAGFALARLVKTGLETTGESGGSSRQGGTGGSSGSGSTTGPGSTGV